MIKMHKTELIQFGGKRRLPKQVGWWWRWMWRTVYCLDQDVDWALNCVGIVGSSKDFNDNRVADVVYYGGDCTYIRIAARDGNYTDLASIPFFAWWLLKPDGPWLYAAIIHDSLCGRKGVTRPVADAIMWQIMKTEEGEYKTSWWERTAIYAAIRVYWILGGKWRNKNG